MRSLLLVVRKGRPPCTPWVRICRVSGQRVLPMAAVTSIWLVRGISHRHRRVPFDQWSALCTRRRTASRLRHGPRKRDRCRSSLGIASAATDFANRCACRAPSVSAACSHATGFGPLEAAHLSLSACLQWGGLHMCSGLISSMAVLTTCFCLPTVSSPGALAHKTRLLPLQFRGGYETALDICLFAFVLQVGWVHAGLAGFYRMVITEQRRFRLSAHQELKKAIFSFYKRQLFVFLVLFLVATAAVLISIRADSCSRGPVGIPCRSVRAGRNAAARHRAVEYRSLIRAGDDPGWC